MIGPCAHWWSCQACPNPSHFTAALGAHLPQWWVWLPWGTHPAPVQLSVWSGTTPHTSVGSPHSHAGQPHWLRAPPSVSQCSCSSQPVSSLLPLTLTSSLMGTQSLKEPLRSCYQPPTSSRNSFQAGLKGADLLVRRKRGFLISSENLGWHSHRGIWLVNWCTPPLLLRMPSVTPA